MSYKELNMTIRKLTKQMHSAAAELDFEKAAMLRDKIMELKKILKMLVFQKAMTL